MSVKSVEPVMVYKSNEWITDMMYVSRDETKTACFTRIVSDTRANFFPEDYEHLMSLEQPPFQYEFDKDEPETETETETTTRITQTQTCPFRSPKYNLRRHLEENEVRHILSLRNDKVRSTASNTAARYGVTSKAIRDIWTGKTWRYLL